MAYTESDFDTPLFGSQVDDPNSEVTEEKTVTKDAAGNETTVIRKNAQNTPINRAAQAQAESETATSQAPVIAQANGGLETGSAFDSIADLGRFGMKSRAAAEGRTGTYVPRVSHLAKTPEGKAAYAEVQLQKGSDKNLAELEVAQAKLSAFDESDLKPTRARGNAQVTAQKKVDELTNAREAFDQDLGLGIYEERTEANTPIDPKAEAGRLIMEQRQENILTSGSPIEAMNKIKNDPNTLTEEVQEASSQLVLTDPDAGRLMQEAALAAGNGDQNWFESLMSNASSFFSDNPMMMQALISAGVSLLSTGSIYKGLAAGLQTFGQGMQTQTATAATAAAAQKKEGLDLRKDGYTAASIKAYQNTGDVATLEWSDHKLQDEFKKIAFRAQVKGETAGQKKTDADIKEFYSWTEGTASRLGEHWSQEEREYHGIPDSTNTVQTAALQYGEAYGIDMMNPDPVVRVNFGEGLDDWNEYNRQAVDNGGAYVDSPLPFIEKRINRAFAASSGLPLEIFNNVRSDKVNGEVLAKARDRVQAATYSAKSPEGTTEHDVWRAWEAKFNEEKDEELFNQAESAGMSPFLFFMETFEGKL